MLITTVTTTPAKKEGLQQGLQAWLQKTHRKQLPPQLPHALPQLFPAVRPHGFTDAPAHHRHPNALDGSCSPASPRHPLQRWERVPSLDTASSTMSDRISKHASEAWRDHLLQQVVDYLESHRDEIIDGFEAENSHNLKREDIEQSDLLDFDVSVTLHRDQSSSFGLGFGFFKANMIR
ncbi:hypothetical protein [Synechococcus sp. WH 8109]|uniref:hypothetical protein n=1 Tax=Synechococcus sp. WH 8109 TaxID=166314 RepID=UPI001E3A3B82|nr:hypothetical protein [Synechococcus sp. WH 8109]